VTVAYDIERVLAASERLCAAISSVLRHDDIPDWMRHRFIRLSAEAEALRTTVEHHKGESR
jgi:hypothetical protein